MKSLSLGLALLVAGIPSSLSATQPNIILLVADDLGYGELGCQGNPQIPTPHIDSLAANGVRFTSGYVTASVCSPSRGGLLTGRYQTRFGWEHNPLGAANADPLIGLPEAQVTLGVALQEAGYITAAIGKWHLGGTARFHPLRRGFDEFFGFLHEGHFYVPPPWNGVTSLLRRPVLPGGGQGRSPEGKLMYHTVTGVMEDAYDADNPILRGGQPVEEATHLTSALTREAVDFISRHKTRPFFLYLAYNAVHSPLQGAEAYLARFAHIEDVHRRIFAAMLAQLDDGIGEVLDRLRREGLEENTLIFFLSDNGGPTQELTSSNAPLRGGKGSMYEGGIRVPFLVQWKGQLPAAKTYDPPVISLDIFTTALAAAGSTGREPVPDVDGVDLVPYLTGERQGQPHELLCWRRGQSAALRHGNWKMVRHSAGSKPELFDLSQDVAETRNLAAKEPGRLQEVQQLWEEWDHQNVPPLFEQARRGRGSAWIAPAQGTQPKT